jgi:hypothetical protein
VTTRHDANHPTACLCSSLRAEIVSKCCAKFQGRAVVDGYPEESQPCQASVEQCRAAHKMPHRDSILKECDLDPVLDHVSQGS